MINYINEICQTESGASSIAGAVGRMGIPNWVVEVRHSATHKLMPKLSMLQKAAEYLKGWIWVIFYFSTNDKHYCRITIGANLFKML